MPHRKFTPFPVLKTDRLLLRQLNNGDANEIFALRTDENVNRYLDRKPSESVQEANTFIEVVNENIQRNDSLYWAITLNGTDKLIGTICLFDFSPDNAKAEIGYELLPGYQGRGLMQEAVSEVIDYAMQQIGLHKMEANSHSENESSQRLLEKFNFTRNGTDGNVLKFTLTPKEKNSTGG